MLLLYKHLYYHSISASHQPFLFSQLKLRFLWNELWHLKQKPFPRVLQQERRGQTAVCSLCTVLEHLCHPHAGRKVIKENSIKKKKRHFTFCSQQKLIIFLVVLLASFFMSWQAVCTLTCAYISAPQLVSWWLELCNFCSCSNKVHGEWMCCHFICCL